MNILFVLIYIIPFTLAFLNDTTEKNRNNSCIEIEAIFQKITEPGESVIFIFK